MPHWIVGVASALPCCATKSSCASNTSFSECSPALGD
jgi:hypothetical protein